MQQTEQTPPMTDPKLPAYSEVIGPEQDILIIADGKDFVAYPDQVYITCENGWVDLEDWR